MKHDSATEKRDIDNLAGTITRNFTEYDPHNVIHQAREAIGAGLPTVARANLVCLESYLKSDKLDVKEYAQLKLDELREKWKELLKS